MSTAAPLPAWPAARATVAGLKRHRPDDDPAVVQAVGTLRAARLAEHIARVVAAAPPLTTEQRDALSALLRPSTAAGAA